jgi:hypothetical protein
VVLVHVEVPAASELEVEPRVEREQRQQMVEEADARLDTRAAAPVEREREPSAVSWSCAGRSPLGQRPGRARRRAPRAATSFSDGRRTVIRIAPGKR